MHNMFLGTAKRVLQNGWLENNLISKKELEIIEERVSSCISPINIGRTVSVRDVSPSLDYIKNCPVQLLPPYVVQKFDSVALGFLRTSYQSFLPEVDPLEIPELYKKHKNVKWLSEQLSTKTHQTKFLCVCAYWVDSSGNIVTNSRNLCAEVEYFFSQRIIVGADYSEIIMVKVRWFQEHSAKTTILPPVEIWCKNLFIPFGPASFMPVIRIDQVCVVCELTN